MKVLLHGATNGTNFGDCLFCRLFADYLSQMGVDYAFFEMPRYGISRDLRDELGYRKRIGFLGFSNYDRLVYISGGYFGDTYGGTKESIKRYVRYFLIGRWFMRKGRTISICGVGGGPLGNAFLRRPVKKILAYSAATSFRDEPSARYFFQENMPNNVFVTADTALVLKRMNVPSFDLRKTCGFDSDKFLFLHVYSNDIGNTPIFRKVIPALNDFLESHDEYSVVVGTDFKTSSDLSELEVYKELKGRKFIHEYVDSDEFCAFLNSIDVAITPKLHVGIVSSALGKSVISLPLHKHKTKRFFNQIGEGGRCVLMADASVEDVFWLLNEYHEKAISVSDDLVDLAYRNLELAVL